MARKSTTDNKKRIEQLLMMAWNTNSVARILAIANQILELNPDCVEALVLKGDHLDDSNESIELFKRALKAIDDPNNCDPFDRDIVFLTVNQRIAFAYLGLGELDKAFEYCEVALKFEEEHQDNEYLHDETNSAMMKALYYRVLIERRDWSRILSDSMRDPDETLGRAFAKLIAAWCMSGDNAKTVCAGLFWDILTIAPDVPFYILGYMDEPDESDPPEANEDFHFSLMDYDTVAVTDELFNWFSRGTILFGLLSGRFDSKELDYMIDAIDKLGGFEEYERMKEILLSTEDSVVIETLAANKCLTE